MQEQIKAREATQGKAELLWQYKWNAADTTVHGPIAGSEMAEWKEEGYFKSGTVVVQRAGASVQWQAALEVASFTE
jgi:hypothetical protein